jgi:plastocyanin
MIENRSGTLRVGSIDDDDREVTRMRRWIPTAALVVGGAAAIAGCGGGGSDGAEPSTTPAATNTTESTAGDALSGSVGPGFEISMDKASVAPGTYTLTVDDEADSHNFHLTGPGGVEVTTEVSEVGEKTFTVDLQAGTYTFVCDPHSSSMNGTLTVE